MVGPKELHPNCSPPKLKSAASHGVGAGQGLLLTVETFQCRKSCHQQNKTPIAQWLPDHREAQDFLAFDQHEARAQISGNASRAEHPGLFLCQCEDKCSSRFQGNLSLLRCGKLPVPPQREASGLGSSSLGCRETQQPTVRCVQGIPSSGAPCWCRGLLCRCHPGTTIPDCSLPSPAVKLEKEVVSWGWQ